MVIAGEGFLIIQGTLRWTGSDFEGYDGSSWLSLTKKLPDSWQTNNNNLFYNLGNCPEEKRVNSNQQLKSTENVLVFPNPAQNTITVQLNTQIEGT